MARKHKNFELVSDYAPSGDQPQAISALVSGIKRGQKQQVLLGVTGSGKTFTMANVIQQIQKPTLILAHNKTLVAQLYQELKEFFPNNAVEYFVSYYDYYQPEAYVPSTDTFIEKDSQINETIDRMRHRATMSLLSRDDVIIVASVSCIYGIGSTQSYEEMSIYVEVGRPMGRDAFMRQLVESQYMRNDIDFSRGSFRARGDVVEVFTAHEDDNALRISFFGDEVESIKIVDPLRGKIVQELTHATIFPASHYATTQERLRLAISSIRDELDHRLPVLHAKNHLLQAQRLEQRTQYDLEMLETIGTCKGIENYSRHLSGRKAGEPSPTLLDYFPRDFLMFIDESHQTVSQVRAMYRGDRARKETLVEHGFRMPSAMDNRPLQFEEFERFMNNVVYVSATPAQYELDKCHGEVVEQLVRPTGLVEPQVEIRPVATQMDDVINEARECVKKGERVLITTLTKRMAEDITDYLGDVGISARYLHSDIDALERMELLRGLRRGDFNVLVGINLLREGLDLPEVALVAIFDADKEGFLRSYTGLVQTIGRAARNLRGRAILYADRLTDSINAAVSETDRRRTAQLKYNEEHNITPTQISKSIKDMGADDESKKTKKDKKTSGFRDSATIEKTIKKLRVLMKAAVKKMDFEQAAEYRDQIHALQEDLFKIST